MPKISVLEVRHRAQVQNIVSGFVFATRRRERRHETRFFLATIRRVVATMGSLRSKKMMARSLFIFGISGMAPNFLVGGLARQ